MSDAVFISRETADRRANNYKAHLGIRDARVQPMYRCRELQGYRVRVTTKSGCSFYISEDQACHAT